MPLTTRSGRLPKAPPRAKDGNEARSRPGPKSANVPRARPKPRPLPRSERSDPLTSSAEEDIFFSNFARRSFVRNKSNDASEEPEAQLPDDDTDNDTQQVEASLRDNSAVLRNESDTGTGISPATAQSDAPSNTDSVIQTNKRENTADPSNADSVIQTNERENTTAYRPRRSGAQRSYLPSDEGKCAESSGSDSDWAATEERRKKAERHADPMRFPSPSTEGHQKGKEVAEAEADNNDDNSEDCDEEDKLEDGDETTRKAGRLSKEAIMAVHDFGKRVQEEATEIGKRFGKHRQVILTEAGLARKATRKESIWNQHQAWFKTVLHPSKEASLQAWKAKQAEHYHAHSYKDPKNAALWKQIREHFDHAIATPDDLSSRESCSLMMAVREMFAKSVSAVLVTNIYW
ncbi:hypothetical protein CY34DRAFT_18327 [Suillus luteus UH-Slu-Lm8-n1]|uniref:Uncharacterized protein n=1 Tax=Suillus luteus UH-Slu-Lm8-n1 TaxID=930992 RepID=A0A0C9ZVW5_9AGAM|nr:hypothetical protein CY34DRAFT_18327 [Suillus luteus UH-Slu-Lm8-n1]